MRSWRKIWAIRLLWLAALLALSAPPTLFTEALAANSKKNVRLTSVHPKPSQAIRKNWMEKYFEGDDLWRFENKSEYEKVLDSVALEPSLRNELLGLYRKSLDPNTFLPEAYIMHDLSGEAGFVLVPPAARKKVSRALLNAVHRYQHQTFGWLPPLYLREPSFGDLDAYFDKAKYSREARRAAAQNVVFLDGDLFLVLDSQLWPHLSPAVRADFVRDSFSPVLSRVGEKVTLVIRRGDNLAEIAQKYAGDRNPRMLERYLQRKLGKKSSVRVPLQEILTPFIRKHINTYATCHGPNCYNAALSANQGREFTQEFTEHDDLQRQLYAKYRFVGPGEPLAVGDLFAYQNVEGQIEHASTYVGDNILFTKNGLNRTSPYLFQRRHETEHLYFQDGNFQLVVYRKARPGERVISESGYFAGARPVFWGSGEMEANEPATKLLAGHSCHTNFDRLSP